MFPLRSHWLLPVALLTLSSMVRAGPVAPASSQGQADPLDAWAAVPAVVYESAFTPYRAHGAETLGPWKAANDHVGRIGGWRAYAREASPADTPAPKAPAAGAAGQPRPPGHGGHPQH